MINGTLRGDVTSLVTDPTTEVRTPGNQTPLRSSLDWSQSREQDVCLLCPDFLRLGAEEGPGCQPRARGVSVAVGICAEPTSNTSGYSAQGTLGRQGSAGPTRPGQAPTALPRGQPSLYLLSLSPLPRTPSCSSTYTAPLHSFTPVFLSLAPPPYFPALLLLTPPSLCL